MIGRRPFLFGYVMAAPPLRMFDRETGGDVARWRDPETGEYTLEEDPAFVEKLSEYLGRSPREWYEPSPAALKFARGFPGIMGGMARGLTHPATAKAAEAASLLDWLGPKQTRGAIGYMAGGEAGKRSLIDEPPLGFAIAADPLLLAGGASVLKNIGKGNRLLKGTELYSALSPFGKARPAHQAGRFASGVKRARRAERRNPLVLNSQFQWTPQRTWLKNPANRAAALRHIIDRSDEVMVGDELNTMIDELPFPKDPLESRNYPPGHYLIPDFKGWQPPGVIPQVGNVRPASWRKGAKPPTLSELIMGHEDPRLVPIRTRGVHSESILEKPTLFGEYRSGPKSLGYVSPKAVSNKEETLRKALNEWIMGGKDGGEVGDRFRAAENYWKDFSDSVLRHERRHGIVDELDLSAGRSGRGYQGQTVRDKNLLRSLPLRDRAVLTLRNALGGEQGTLSGLIEEAWVRAGDKADRINWRYLGDRQPEGSGLARSAEEIAQNKPWPHLSRRKAGFKWAISPEVAATYVSDLPLPIKKLFDARDLANKMRAAPDIPPRSAEESLFGKLRPHNRVWDLPDGGPMPEGILDLLNTLKAQ